MTQEPKLKLIYIVTQAEWGGAQRYVFDLANELKDNYEIIVAAGKSNDNELLKKCASVGIKTYQFKELVRNIKPIKDIAAIFELARFFNQERPDIIHLNSSKAGLIGALAYKLLKAKNYKLKTKIIYTAHGWVFNEPLSSWKKFLYKLLEYVAGKIHNKIIVLSQYDYEIAIENKICSPAKLIMIPHGIKAIDLLPREIAREKLTASYQSRLGETPLWRHLLATNSPWLGTIANLYTTKGIGYLIEAIKNLRDQGLEPQFIVIGNGPLMKSHKLQAASCKLNNFHLVGTIHDAARYLKAFDIFILPSVKEGMPYAILEAMQAELPIIATSVGAIPEMLENNKDALIVKPEETRLLSEAIKELLENEGIRNKLGAEARKRIDEKFNFDKVIRKIRSIYNEL